MSRITTLTDSIAKSLWSGEVAESSPRTTASATGNLSGRPGYQTYRKEFPVRKDDGLRRGTVPQHITSPQQGKPRAYDPFTLRKLANTEPVQACVNTIVSDMRAIPLEVVPRDEEAKPPEKLLAEIERALNDPNPNPEGLTDINEMLLRDALEVGNCSAIINPEVDGRRAEVLPFDPNTFTLDWDAHRLLTDFWQYPQASGSGRFGQPERIDPELVMWGVANPETQRAGFYGKSPVEILQNVINVLGGLVESEINELEEGMPPGILSLVGDNWSDADYSHFETYWQNEVKGAQHKVPYTRGEASFEPFNHSYEELQVLERQQWYHKLVGAVFNVPVSESGLQVGETNRATDVSIRQKYKQNGLRPWLSLLEELWTTQYIWRYWSEEVRVQFNPGLDLLERKELATIHAARLRDGVMTINEVREEMGKEPLEWGDQPFDRQLHYRAQLRAGEAEPATEPEPELEAELLEGEGDGTGTTPEQEASTALEEGLSQEVELEPEGNFKSQAGTGSTWLAALHVSKAEAEGSFREDAEAHQFGFQPGEISELSEELEAVFSEYIEAVLDQVRGNQHLLRSEASSKSANDFLKLIKEEIGLEFAQDVAEVLTEHKQRKVLDGESDILTELSQAGLSLEDVEAEQIRDRVKRRLQQRTLQVTKPISQRLEEELRETLQEGWQQGQSIEEIERSIEELTDKWQGTDAERLARDQLGKATKEGRMSYAEETADKIGGWSKTWISTGDHRTRESHDQMDGVTVPQSEPFEVDYSPDGGPASVKEMYPGESQYGIQCRCDYALKPRATVQKSLEWAQSPPSRMEPRIREVESEQGQGLGELLLSLEGNPEISRQQAAKQLGISKRTYYGWLGCAGLKE